MLSFTNRSSCVLTISVPKYRIRLKIHKSIFWLSDQNYAFLRTKTYVSGFCPLDDKEKKIVVLSQNDESNRLLFSLLKCFHILGSVFHRRECQWYRQSWHQRQRRLPFSRRLRYHFRDFDVVEFVGWRHYFAAASSTHLSFRHGVSGRRGRRHFGRQRPVASPSGRAQNTKDSRPRSAQGSRSQDVDCLRRDLSVFLGRVFFQILGGHLEATEEKQPSKQFWTGSRSSRRRRGEKKEDTIGQIGGFATRRSGCKRRRFHLYNLA